MSNKCVSIIKIEPFWFFADFTDGTNGWNVKRLKSAGTNHEQALIRAMSSAQMRNLPFTELDFPPEIEREIIDSLKKHCTYRKAVRQHAKLVKTQDERASNCNNYQPAPVAVGVCSDIATAYFDGSSRAGVSAAGVVIDLPGGRSITKTESIPRASSSEAEYAAAILALRTSLELGCSSLILKGDCQEVILHLKAGTSRSAKSSHLLELHNSALALISQFEDLGLEWIPREQNHRAHDAAKKIVLSLSKNSKSTKKKAIPFAAPALELQQKSLPTMPACQQLADQINRMVQLGSKARVSDYEALKSGWDEFSRLRLPILLTMVPDVVVDAIAHQMPQLCEKDLAKTYRWILRGLPAYMAVRKLEVDANTARSVVKALRRTRY